MYLTRRDMERGARLIRLINRRFNTTPLKAASVLLTRKRYSCTKKNADNFKTPSKQSKTKYSSFLQTLVFKEQVHWEKIGHQIEMLLKIPSQGASSTHSRSSALCAWSSCCDPRPSNRYPIIDTTTSPQQVHQKTLILKRGIGLIFHSSYQHFTTATTTTGSTKAIWIHQIYRDQSTAEAKSGLNPKSHKLNYRKKLNSSRENRTCEIPKRDIMRPKGTPLFTGHQPLN